MKLRAVSRGAPRPCTLQAELAPSFDMTRALVAAGRLKVAGGGGTGWRPRARPRRAHVALILAGRISRGARVQRVLSFDFRSFAAESCMITSAKLRCYLECGDLRVLASRNRCRRHRRCTYQAASCRAPSCLVAPQAAAPADASNTRLVEASADADARASSHAAATSAAARCSPCCSSLR